MFNEIYFVVVRNPEDSYHKFNFNVYTGTRVGDPVGRIRHIGGYTWVFEAAEDHHFSAEQLERIAGFLKDLHKETYGD